MFELIKYGIYVSAINMCFLFLVAGMQTRNSSQKDFSQLQYSAGMNLILALIWLIGLAIFGVFQYLTEGLL